LPPRRRRSQTGRYRTPALSPDGRTLAYTDNVDGDVKILDLQRGMVTPLTTEPDTTEAAPVWSPDGARIYYRTDNDAIFVKDTNGTSPAIRLLTGGLFNGPSQALDHPRLGKLLLFFATLPNRPSQDVFILPLDSQAGPKAIVESRFADVEPQVSPDGRWLAYASSDLGELEVFVQPFPPDGRRWRISSAGGRQPMWRADSRELFFVSDQRRFYAVSLPDPPQSFDTAVPRPLFEMRANVYNTRNSYVPSQDGQRFLVNLLLDTPDAPISVVYNWAGEMK
jgi:Tol biopolymer transport system component